MTDILISAGILGAVKIFLVVLLLLFVVFAFIVVRQVQLMNRVVTVSISGGLKFVAYILLAVSVGIFLVSLVVL